MKSIHHKRALITGAAAGIGRALALRLARAGADLVLLDVDEIGLARVVDEARQLGVAATGRACDVSQPRQIESCTQWIIERWSGVDILINNAGITYYGLTEQMSFADCERLLAINLHAPIHFTRALLPTLLARPEAHVLNVASFLGLIGTRRLAVYTTSKFGLVGFSESLRAEYGKQGLGVTALCPGFVDTRLFDTAPRGPDQTQPKRPPRWLLTTPEKVADRAVRAIHRNQAVAVPQRYAQVAYLGKRLFPGLYDWAHHLSRKRKRPQAPPQAPKSTSPSANQAA